MSNIQQHEENSKCDACTPLARFFHKGHSNDYATTQHGAQQIPHESSDRSECSNSSKEGWCKTHTEYASYASKPKHRQGLRKSKHHQTDSNSNENNAIPRVDGHCRCGARAEAPYFERCENCFAEDSERWNGRDQSAIIHW